MAHMLVQQQAKTLPSTSNEQMLPLAHQLDDIFYTPGSTNLLELLQKLASDKYSSASNGPRSKTSSVSEPIIEEKLCLNCDELQPIIPESVQITNIDSISSNVSPNNDCDEDALVNENSSSNNCDRHFRRRKRRSSLTKTLLDNDTIEKVDDNNNSQLIPQEEISQEIQLEKLSINDNEQSAATPPPPLRRRLRFRSSRLFGNSAEQTISDKPVEFFIATESATTPPPSPISPLPSPTQTTGGALKRSGSLNTTKKMVRFADSVGRELAQVQYIRAFIDDEVEKNDRLFIQNKLAAAEYKPWSFDISPSSKQSYDSKPARRFFCLFRQPNSEHPDIYLHDVWKSQIKLEYAEIRLKPNSNNEQYLHGSVWVTNAGYNKNVTVKYSFNRWVSSYEHEAQHKCHSNDFRNLDRFEFNIDIPHDVDRIDFVLRYHVNWQEHWDNNEGKNYTIESESSSMPHVTISLPHDYDFNEMRFY